VAVYMHFMERIDQGVDRFLSKTLSGYGEHLYVKLTWYWAMIACLCVAGMTLLSVLLNLKLLSLYGMILLAIYAIVLPSPFWVRAFNKLFFYFLLSVIIITFVFILLLGGILQSAGLFMVGLTCAISSFLLGRMRWTVILFGIYVAGLVAAVVLQPILSITSELSPEINRLYFVINIIWMTGSSFGFIMFYLGERSKSESREVNRLKELEKARNSIYTSITHEFRTPLTIIRGLSEQIREEKGTEIEKRTRSIESNVVKMTDLLDQVLDFSRVQSGSLPVHRVYGDLVPYMDEICQGFFPLAEKKQIRFQFLSDLESCLVEFEPVILRHITRNLLSNAFKFTPRGKSVELILQVENKEPGLVHQERMIIKVVDTGIGMKEEELGKIFDRFYRIRKDEDSIPEGSGLGLTFTRELVSLLEGQISVSSKPGAGSEFIVSLPLITTREHQDIEKKTDQAHSTNEAALSTSITNARKEPLLLIVEDNKDLMEYLISVLEPDYRILAARNGEEGLGHAIRSIPDIILSDVMMPVMDGFAMLEKIRQDHRTSHIPVILLTARGDITSRLEGLAKDANDYLAKPVNREELMLRLKGLLSSRLKMQQYFASEDFAKMAGKPFPLEISFIEQVQKIVDQNLANQEFSISMLCREMHMSRTQVYRKFNALTNQSVNGYIRTLRLKRAKHLLENSELSVSEVAYSVGFKDLSHFSRSFTHEFKVKPSEIKHHQAHH